MSNQEIKLSFVILNYKTKNLLRLCLENIFRANLGIPFEVIVIDNFSNENLFDLAEKFPAVKFIFNKENLGHAQGNNIGLKKASGKYIAILNTDIIFKNKQAIETILEFMDKNNNVAILGPKLVNPDGSVQKSCFRKYSLLTPIYRRTPLGLLYWGRKDIARHLMNDFSHEENREIDWILGACMFLRKEVLERIGYFNEKFFLYFADFELCDRAINNGFKVIYFAKSDIIHYHKRESDKGSFLKHIFSYPTRMHIKDWLKYLKK